MDARRFFAVAAVLVIVAGVFLRHFSQNMNPDEGASQAPPGPQPVTKPLADMKPGELVRVTGKIAGEGTPHESAYGRAKCLAYVTVVDGIHKESSYGGRGSSQSITRTHRLMKVSRGPDPIVVDVEGGQVRLSFRDWTADGRIREFSDGSRPVLLVSDPTASGRGEPVSWPPEPESIRTYVTYEATLQPGDSVVVTGKVGSVEKSRKQTIVTLVASAATDGGVIVSTQ